MFKSSKRKTIESQEERIEYLNSKESSVGSLSNKRAAYSKRGTHWDCPWLERLPLLVLKEKSK